MTSSRVDRNKRIFGWLRNIIETFEGEPFTIHQLKDRWIDSMGTRHLPTTNQLGNYLSKMRKELGIEEIGVVRPKTITSGGYVLIQYRES